ncbi:MAG: metallophosphoesterase family protein [Patescibacteria group bacterium]
MRLLHTSDWHLGRNLEGRSRLPEQAQFIDELVEIVTREDVHLVLVAGDVFDQFNPSAEAEELFYYALERLAGGGKRAVAAIAGNHDSPDRLHAANPLALKHGISLLGYPKEQLPPGAAGGVHRINAGPGWLELGVSGADEPVIIYALPYPSESRLNEVLAEDLDEASQQLVYSDRVGRLFAGADRVFRPDAVNIVVAHLFALGGAGSESERQLGGALAVSPLALPAKAQYVALGHLHRPQQVHNAPRACRYAGSPLSYSFSEADQRKEVVIADILPGGEAQVRSVGLSSGRALKRWRARSLAEARAWCAESGNQEAWVDLEVESDHPLEAAELIELRKLHPGIIGIRPIYPELTAQTEDRRLSEMSLADRFKLFHQRERGVDPPEELVKFFLEMVNAQEPPAEAQDEAKPTGGKVA